MISDRRSQIKAAFSAALDYDAHARVQHTVATELADRIAALPLPEDPRILEIGCGTGFLTQALADRGIRGEWLITDLSPVMVERCRQRVGETGNRRFAVFDGEYGAPEHGPRFDLICSSLAMQWFDDIERAVTRMLGWLPPGGHCIFTTLAAGTFAEWQEAHRGEQADAGTPRFPSVAQLAAMEPAGEAGTHWVSGHRQTHSGARDFLRSLKAIGADTPSAHHQPLAPATLRRVMRAFEDAGSTITYEVVTCHFTRERDA